MIELPSIEATEITEKELSGFSKESSFMALSVAILAEVGSYVTLLACILPPNTRSWDADQAVLGGHFVRLSKLIQAVLDQTCQKRRETSFIFARMAFECVVNITYMLRNYSTDLMISYKTYSLQHEKRLLNRINQSIEDNKGAMLPIERRMLVSIERAFKLSNMTYEEIKPGSQRNWGEKNTYEKAKNVGLDKAYLACFSGPSHGIHGNWQDLLDNHLIVGEDGGFTPNLDWRLPRPQYLNAVAFHSTLLSREYLNWLRQDDTDSLTSSLSDLADRISKLDEGHEEWIQRNMPNT